MMHWLFHKWGKWEDGTATYSPGPILRWSGITSDFQKPIQGRKCLICGKTEIREVMP